MRLPGPTRLTAPQPAAPNHQTMDAQVLERHLPALADLLQRGVFTQGELKLVAEELGVPLGLGRIVASYYFSSTLYQIH